MYFMGRVTNCTSNQGQKALVKESEGCHTINFNKFSGEKVTPSKDRVTTITQYKTSTNSQTNPLEVCSHYEGFQKIYEACSTIGVMAIWEAKNV